MSASQTRIQRTFSLLPTPESESAAGSGFSTDSWSEVDAEEKKDLSYLVDFDGGVMMRDAGHGSAAQSDAGESDMMGVAGEGKEGEDTHADFSSAVNGHHDGDGEPSAHLEKGKERLIGEVNGARPIAAQDLTGMAGIFEEGIYDSDEEEVVVKAAQRNAPRTLDDLFGEERSPSSEPTHGLSLQDQLKLLQNTLYHHQGQLLAHLAAQSIQIGDLQKEVYELKSNPRTNPHPLRPAPGISPETVTELATSLATGEVDGYQAAETMFTWVEGCQSEPKLNEGRDGLEPMVRVGNLEGVLDVTLGRVGRLEREVEGMKREMMDAEIGTVIGDEDRGDREMSLSGMSGGDNAMNGMSGSQGSLGGDRGGRRKRAKVMGYADGVRGKGKIVQSGEWPAESGSTWI